MEDEYPELNNELVVPSYRLFCEALNLPFHFSEGLPVDLRVREEHLHKEAMDLFNRLKPKLVLFKQNVVSYQFTDWGGGFSSTITPIQEFLEEAADQLFHLRHLERRFELLSSLWIGTLCCLSFVLVTLVSAESLSAASLWPNGLLGLVVSAGLGLLSSRAIHQIPRRIVDDGRLKGVAERINRLRSQIVEIRGDRPDPILQQRQQRIGSALLSELRESMTEDEIRRLVRRLQSQLFVVPSDKS